MYGVEQTTSVWPAKLRLPQASQSETPNYIFHSTDKGDDNDDDSGISTFTNTKSTTFSEVRYASPICIMLCGHCICHEKC